MKAERKAEWCAALRSGKYKQGTGQLKEVIDGVPQYCCLGVLAEIDGALIKVDRALYYEDWTVPNPLFDDDTNRSSGYYQGKLDGKYEITEEQMFKLANMNDRLASFSEIADYIEASL